MIHAARWWGDNVSSEGGRCHHFMSVLYVALNQAAYVRVTLDEEAVKAYMEATTRETPLTRDELIEDFEQYAGCISHATAAYNSFQGTNTATAPAAPPPAPVAKTAEELRRRAKYLTKKLNETSGLQARVDAGLTPNDQQAEKLARRGELEKELAAAMEALAVT